MGNKSFSNFFKMVSVFFVDTIIFGILIYIILQFLDIIPMTTNFNITMLSVITIFLLLYVFFRSRDRYGMSAALLAYLIFTQFGMSTIFYLFGSELLSSFSNTTLKFLTSPMYSKAVIIGLVAVICYVYGIKLGSKGKKKLNTELKPRDYTQSNLVYYTGMSFLLITLLYLILFIVSGRIYLGMSYHSYLNSGIVNGFYSWILFMYSSGMCFTIAVADKVKLRNAIILFGLSAIIFFSTGNRGEVLYATLATMGVLYYKSNKLKFKYIFIAIGLVFIIIPFIRATRNMGTTSIIDLLTVNIFDSFAEMGHQLRLSVLILEDFVFGSREFLWGFSYYDPFINIIDNFIPGSIQLPRPQYFNFETAFSGLGFSQVAESFANFGILGVSTYHFLIAFFIRKAEIRNLQGIDLAYWGTILAILINATRNRFAFVIGQLLVLSMIMFIIKIFSNKKIVMVKGKRIA